MKALGFLIGGVCTGLALAQSINIDLAPQAGIPSAGYAAAGLAGVWNDATGHDAGNLRDLDGMPTGASLGGTFAIYPFVLNDPGTSGDEAALLDDGAWGAGDVLLHLTINRLQPGVYDVYVYGIAGGMPNERTLFEVGDWYGLTGGAYTGQLVEGVTHAAFTVQVGAEGAISIGIAGGIWGQSGYFNGLQLVFEPCRADGNRDGVLNFFDVLLFLSWFSAHDPHADLNFDGQYNFPDVQQYLSLFSAGCP
ncbi:MAG: hypothetical protein KJZ65_13670 [Phycisphaerales bacterium]|nr:hypothetical protein [Phycisphaerales bacterium]